MEHEANSTANEPVHIERALTFNKRDIAFLLIFIGLVGFQFFKRAADSLRLSVLPENAGETRAVPSVDYFYGAEIRAQAAIVWDARDDVVLYGKNEFAQLPLASLTKVMTASIALEAGMAVATVTKEAILAEGDSGLMVGEQWVLPELATFTLVASANDGANMLASAWQAFASRNGESREFVDVMNDKAKQLGLSQTYFLNETGLDVSPSTAGAYGSAADFAKLFYLAVASYPDVFQSTAVQTVELQSKTKKHSVKNTNVNVEEFSGIVASKTGYTPLAGGNLAVLVNAGLNHPIVVVVLGSTQEERFTDAKKLADRALLAVSSGNK